MNEIMEKSKSLNESLSLWEIFKTKQYYYLSVDRVVGENLTKNGDIEGF